MRIESTACTHIGRRSNNEDAYCAEPALGLFAVADGMGGYEGGEVASHLAIEAIRDFVRRNAGDDDVTWPFAVDPGLRVDENLLAIAVRIAHAEVVRRKHGKLAQMGSTVAALLLSEDHAILAHLGDSRIYRLRDDLLEQLTVDHSVYEELRKAQGGTSLPPKDQCGFGHMITRALGMDPSPISDLRRERLLSGDTFLLCTDGLSEIVPEDELADVLAQPELQDACRRLIERAYELGGRDNITAVVLRALAP